MAKNNIFRFGNDADPSDTLTNSEYDSDSERTIGHQVGVARNTLANKLGAGTSAIATAIAQVMVDRSGKDVSDTDSTDSLVTKIKDLVDDASTLTGTAPRSVLPKANTQGFGAVKRATEGEANAGSDNALYVTPAQLSSFVEQTLESIYPVGSTYTNVEDSTNPGSFLPGSWRRMRDGFLYPQGAPESGDAGITGGETDVALVNANNGPHYHQLAGKTLVGGSEQHDNYINYKGGGDETFYTRSQAKTQKTGSGQPHNNMPPYLTVYMWKRVS